MLYFIDGEVAGGGAHLVNRHHVTRPFPIDLSLCDEARVLRLPDTGIAVPASINRKHGGWQVKRANTTGFTAQVSSKCSVRLKLLVTATMVEDHFLP